MPSSLVCLISGDDDGDGDADGGADGGRGGGGGGRGDCGDDNDGDDDGDGDDDFFFARRPTVRPKPGSAPQHPARPISTPPIGGTRSCESKHTKHRYNKLLNSYRPGGNGGQDRKEQTKGRTKERRRKTH